MIIMSSNKNRSNSVNDTVSLFGDNVALGSGSVEQAVQDCHQATVSLIACYPGQSSPNLLRDTLSKQVCSKSKRSHQNKINRSKFNIASVKNSINFGARSVNNKTESVVEFILEHKLDIL